MKINRKLTIKKLLNKLPFENKYLSEDIVNSLKNEGGEEVEVEFFKLDKYVTASDLTKEYEKRNLVPDFEAIITFVLENPKELEEKKYIAVQDEDNRCVTFFRSFRDERGVCCLRSDGSWYDDWWFGGVRKLDTGISGSSVSNGSLILGHLKILENEIKEIRKLL